MSETTKGLVYWTPRLLCIAFAAFLAIFALDVFGMPVSLPKKLLALFMHLIPTWLVLLTLAVVWRREWIAAVIFPLLAVLHLATMWGRLNWPAFAIIDGPLFLLAVLFLLSWRNRAKWSQSPTT